MIEQIISYIFPFSLYGCGCTEENRDIVLIVYSDFLQNYMNEDDRTLENWKNFAKEAYPNYKINGNCAIRCFKSVWDESKYGEKMNNAWDIPSNEIDCNLGPQGPQVVPDEEPEPEKKNSNKKWYQKILPFF